MRAQQILSVLLTATPAALASYKAQSKVSLPGFSANVGARSPPAALLVSPRATSSSCDSDETTCEDGCMPLTGVCCNQGKSTYCYSGDYCTASGCCPEGETCSDDGTGEATCGIGETECDGLCMPTTGTCCNDGSGYCANFSTCTATGCCPLGKSCDGSSSSGSGSGSSSGSSGSSFTTSDDFDSFTTSDLDSFTYTRTTDLSSASGTSTSSTSWHSFTGDATTTSDPFTAADATPTAMPPGGMPGVAAGAGNVAADGRVVAGLAVAAALLI